MKYTIYEPQGGGQDIFLGLLVFTQYCLHVSVFPLIEVSATGFGAYVIHRRRTEVPDNRETRGTTAQVFD